MLKISITNRRNKIKSRLLSSSSSSSSLSWTWCSNQELLAAQAVLYAVVSNQPTIPCQPPTNPPAPNSPTNPCHLPNLPFHPLKKNFPFPRMQLPVFCTIMIINTYTTIHHSVQGKFFVFFFPTLLCFCKWP